MPDTPLEKLKKLTASDTEPALTEDELGELLSDSSLEDREGRAPADEDWTPTYDLNAAAASAWLIKAARASSTTETDPDSLHVTSKVFDNCRRMAAIFSSKGNRSVSVSQGSE